MNYATSRQHRRLVGRLAKGENIINSIERLCKRESIRAGTFSAIGLLNKLEIQSYDAASAYETTLEAEGSFELLSLIGNISTLGGQTIINCYVHVSTRQLGQAMTFGGRLYEGVALAVEFVIEAYDDLFMERRFDTRLGLPLLNKIETASGESSVDRAPPPPSSSRPASVISKPIQSLSRPTAVKDEETEAPPEKEEAKEEAPKPRESSPRAYSSEGATTVTDNPAPKIVRRPTKPNTIIKPLVKAEPEAGAGGGASWADAIQHASKKKEEKRLAIKPARRSTASKKAIVDDWPEFPDIEPGDMLKHPHFGLCKILYVEEDDFVRVRMRGGKVVDIKLEVCELTLSDDEQDGNRVFNCKIVRR